jgi:hypothetical protein
LEAAKRLGVEVEARDAFNDGLGDVTGDLRGLFRTLTGCLKRDLHDLGDLLGARLSERRDPVDDDVNAGFGGRGCGISIAYPDASRAASMIPRRRWRRFESCF